MLQKLPHSIVEKFRLDTLGEVSIVADLGCHENHVMMDTLFRRIVFLGKADIHIIEEV
jgi:hypothetical protein